MHNEKTWRKTLALAGFWALQQCHDSWRTRQVVRIEAGMVIVDTKDVDQEGGEDLDPEHEKAEVED